MKNKILIIISVIMIATVGIIFYHQHNARAAMVDPSAQRDYFFPGEPISYESWPHSSKMKADDKLFIPLNSSFNYSLDFSPNAGVPKSNDSVILDFNGDGFSDIAYGHHSLHQNQDSEDSSKHYTSIDYVVVLYLNNGKGGYTEGYKCASQTINSDKDPLQQIYYGDCADTSSSLVTSACILDYEPCYYQQWPHSTVRKTNDKLFYPLYLLAPRDREFGCSGLTNRRTVLDYNGDGLSDLLLHYCYEIGSGSNTENYSMVLYLNDSKGGYDEYYTCTTILDYNQPRLFYGDCAAN